MFRFFCHWLQISTGLVFSISSHNTFNHFEFFGYNSTLSSASAAYFNESVIFLFIDSESGANVSLNPDFNDALVASIAPAVAAFLVPTSDSIIARLSIFNFSVLPYLPKTFSIISTIPPGASSYLATIFLIADSAFFYCFSTASSASSFLSSSFSLSSSFFCFLISFTSYSSTTLSATTPSSYFLSLFRIIFLTSLSPSSSSFSYLSFWILLIAVAAASSFLELEPMPLLLTLIA